MFKVVVVNNKMECELTLKPLFKWVDRTIHPFYQICIILYVHRMIVMHMIIDMNVCMAVCSIDLFCISFIKIVDI